MDFKEIRFEKSYLSLGIGIDDAMLKSCKLPTAKLVYENWFRTTISMNNSGTPMEKGKTFNNL